MKNECYSCKTKNLDKNTIGLNKKLLGTKNHNYLCIACLASFLDITEEDLLDKIEEFKDEGCTLFE